jgi:hypothetical protein
MTKSAPIASLLAMATLVLAPRASASDDAYAKMMECLKLPAASAEQDACVNQVKRMTAQQPKPKSASAAKAPAGPVAKATAAPAPDAAAKAKQAAAAPPVPAEVKQAAAVLALNGTNRSGIDAVVAVDISGLDLEAAMMAVQSQRANLLEGQLKEQLELIRKRNEEIAMLNRLLGNLRTNRPGGSDPGAWGPLGKDRKAAEDLLASLRAAGLTMPAGADAVKETGTPGGPSAKQLTFDNWVAEIKGKIDSLSNSQQMDMLRMQSLTNKRNEAFELMTNFVKKMADSRSAVVGNLR